SQVNPTPRSRSTFFSSFFLLLHPTLVFHFPIKSSEPIHSDSLSLLGFRFWDILKTLIWGLFWYHIRSDNFFMLSKGKMGLKQAIKSLDAFPRAEDHLLQKTQSGALVSIVGLIIMATLFLHELRYYLTTYTVHELRLNSHGHIIGTEYLSDLVEKEHEQKHDHEHSDHGSHMDGAFDQTSENMIKKVKQALANGEGCRVYGVLDVQRVAGNFHISVHGLNIFVAQMIFEGSKNVNVSHIIHDLSFGPKYPGIHNPLDETSRILREASGVFKYYIKIVPTEYRYIWKEVLPTNQFSVTEYFSPMKDFDRSWPAVYFLYDLSPITVTIKEERRSFLHFITRLCAVLGGTFALTGLLDRWMFRLIEAVTKPNARSVLR
ncbi:hypothetical protein G4B88_020329, partial [Cannabis sativa]